jgi:hypothetical protein
VSENERLDVVLEGPIQGELGHAWMGVYEPKEVNGRSVWQALGGIDRYLFYGTKNAWYVTTGSEEWVAGVDAGVMSVTSTAATPDQITGTWRVFDIISEQWQPVSKLRARVCSSAEKHAAAEKIKQEQAQALARASEASVLVVEGISEDQHGSMGMYQLVEGCVMNKRAVWCRRGEGEERFLYYATSSEWIISDREDMEADEGEGFLSVESIALTPDQSLPSELWQDLQEDTVAHVRVRVA